MRYLKARNELIFESLLNESVIYFSNSVTYALNKIKNIPESAWGIKGFIKGNGPDEKEINDPNDENKKLTLKGKYIERADVLEFINKMLKLNYKDLDNNIVYVDFVHDNSSGRNVVKVNFIQDNLIKSMGDNNKLDDYKLDSSIITEEPNMTQGLNISNRLGKLYDSLPNGSSTKLGRFLSSLPIRDKSGNKYNPAIIEEVAKKITIFIVNGKLADEDETQYELKEVTGREIEKYYTKESIVPSTFSDHEDSLNQSCMIGSECKGFFEIYINNPKQISLLVYIKKDTGKLLGRALIWTNRDGDRYMDNIYCVNTHVKNIFKKYKDENCNGNFETIQLSRLDFDRYPYLDTFYYADFNRNMLSRKPGYSFVNIRTKNGIIGSSEAAGIIYQEVPDDMDEADFTKSEFYNGYIPSDEGVNTEDGFVYLDDTVEISTEDGDVRILKSKAVKSYNNGIWYRNGDDRLVELSEEYYETEENPDMIAYEEYDEVIEDHNGKYILRDDSIYFIDNLDYDGSFNLDLSVCHEFDDDEVRMDTYTSMIISNSYEGDVTYDEDEYYDLDMSKINGIRKSLTIDGEFPFDKELENIKLYDVDGTPYCSFFLENVDDLEEYDGNNGLLKQALFLSKNKTINGISLDDIQRMYEDDYDTDYLLIINMCYGLSTSDEDMYNKMMENTNYKE